MKVKKIDTDPPHSDKLTDLYEAILKPHHKKWDAIWELFRALQFKKMVADCFLKKMNQKIGTLCYTVHFQKGNYYE